MVWEKSEPNAIFTWNKAEILALNNLTLQIAINDRSGGASLKKAILITNSHFIILIILLLAFIRDLL